MKSWHVNSLAGWPIFFLILITTCLLLTLGSLLLNRPAEFPGVTSGLRGGTVVILRFPSQTKDIQQIWIREDGIAARGYISSGSRRKVQLKHEEWRAVNNLRKEWCVSSPQFAASQKDEAYYEIGLLCGAPFNIRYKQFQIPEDQLPTSLAALLASVPAP